MNTDLAEELNRRVDVDQDWRINRRPAEADEAAYAKWRKQLTTIDADNTAWLRGMVTQYGWPIRSLVGAEASHAAWLLAQHADHDPAFQHHCLELMLAAADGEVSKQEVAYLTDRLRVAEDQPQVYGTQYVRDPTNADRWTPGPIDDIDNVDRRRGDMGLTTLQQNIDEINAGHSYGTKASSLKRHREK